VARAALDAGARLVNDVSGGLADPTMAPVLAAAGVPYVAMHWRAPSRHMRAYAVYQDVVSDVAAELRRRVDVLTAAGVGAGQLILDPGLGFAKRPEHDWALLAHLADICSLGFPVLVGASRKSFLGAMLGAGDPVHDAAASLAAVRVAAAWAAPGAAGAGPGRAEQGRAQVDAVPAGAPAP
jgi:dihydropteroate synthase